MRKILFTLVAGLLLGSCSSSSAAELSNDTLIGRWENQDWNIEGKPLFVQFKPDGTLSFLGTDKWVNSGEWLILESGELQVITGSKTRRCGVIFDDSAMILTQGGCFRGWEDAGDSIVLNKQ